MPALHERIAADLRSSIHDGTLAAGDRLPTEQDLMARYGASRSPIRQALQTLANEGLIDTATSRGTFVRGQRPLTLYASRYEREHRAVSPVDAFRSELLAQGRDAGQTFEMSIIPASEAVASRLLVAEESLVVLRRLVRTVDDKPSLVQDSYYPYDLAEGTEILSPNDVERGIIAVLAEKGHAEIGYVDEIRPRMPPTNDERRLLQLGPGVPVLDQIRTAFTASRPVRLTWNIWAADGIRLVYEIGDLRAMQNEPK